MSKTTVSVPLTYKDPNRPYQYKEIPGVFFDIVFDVTPNTETKKSTCMFDVYLRSTQNAFTNVIGTDTPENTLKITFSYPSSPQAPENPVIYDQQFAFGPTTWNEAFSVPAGERILVGDSSNFKVGFTNKYVGAIEHLVISYNTSYQGAPYDSTAYVKYDPGVASKVYFERRTPETTVLNVNNFNDEQNPSFSYSLGYTDDVTATAKLAVGSWKITRTLDSLSTSGSYTFQLTDSERTGLRNELANSTSGKAKVTFEATTSVGTASSSGSAIVTIINANPTISGTYTIVGGATSIIAGNNKVKVYCNATFKKGAIEGKGYKITCGNQSIFTPIGTFYDLDVNKIVFSVTDSRGNTASQTVTITEMVDYIPLTCVIESTNPVEDSDGNITSTFNISGAYYNGSFGSTPNTLTLKYRKKINSTVGDWENISTAGIITGNRYSTSVSIVTSKTATVSIEVQATDNIKTVSSNSTKVSVTPVFDWSGTDFNFNVPIYLNGKLIPLISESGTFTSGNYTFYYRKWNDGVSEAWGHISGSVTIPSSSNFGGLYSSEEISASNITFPQGLFIDRPDVIAQLESSGAVGFLVGSTTGASATQSGSYQIVQPSYGTYPRYTICYQIRGRWKV